MSWQLKLLNLQLRLVCKPIIDRLGDVTSARQQMNIGAAMGFRPGPVARHLVRPGGLHWIGSGPSVQGRVILYFHGGGYIVGSPWTHAGMVARLSRLAQTEVCAPDYRLAPDTPFPGAFEDACAAWDRVMAQGYAPHDVVIGGDSAGGGLALALLAWLCGKGCPPAGAFALSPWTDLTLSGASLRENADSDVVLPAERIAELSQYYLQGADPRDPRASPLLADFPSCPPVLLQVSTTEILRDDSRRMAARLRDQGAQVALFERPQAPHVWHIFDGWIDEARQDLTAVARFAQNCFAPANR